MLDYIRIHHSALYGGLLVTVRAKRLLMYISTWLGGSDVCREENGGSGKVKALSVFLLAEELCLTGLRELH